LNAAVEKTGCESLTVVTDRYTPDRRRVGAKPSATVAAEIPKDHFRIVTRAKGLRVRLRTIEEKDLPNVPPVRTCHVPALSRGCLPDVDSFVVGAARDKLPVGTEVHSLDPPAMAIRQPFCVSGVEIPDLHRVAVAAGRN
jgi:hypothetical protein